MKPGVKLYIESDSREGFFGDGRCRLLEAVAETGSILKAAQALGRGYRKAWSDIKDIEDKMGRKVVEKSRGGSEGGYTRLTVFGERFVKAWKEYRKEIVTSVEDSFERHLKGIADKGDGG